MSCIFAFMFEPDSSRHAPPRIAPGCTDQPSASALTYEQIEHLLDEYLDPVLSSRRTSEEPARGLLPLTLEQQQFALHWTDIIRKSNAEMAYQFVSHAPKAFKLMALDGAHAWLLHAIDVYDKEGLYPGSAALNDLESFAREYRLSHITVRLEQVTRLLHTFITGLAGRPLKLEAGDRLYTDTDTLFLPAQINRFNDREKNYRLYKALAVHLWAQTWFGTFRRPHPDSPHLLQLIAGFADQGRALRLFNRLETIRLNACIERELPGLAREMLALHTAEPHYDNSWKKCAATLARPTATVADTLAATAALYALQTPWPEPLIYQGEFDLNAAATGIEQRLAEQKNALQRNLNQLLDEPDAPGDAAPDSTGFAVEHRPEPDMIAAITLDGQPLSPPPQVHSLLQSMRQDLDQLPEDWLVAAGDGGYRNSSNADKHPDEAAQKGDQAAVFSYREWDYRRQTYRKQWCVLRELDAHPVYDGFAAATLEKYTHLVGQIHKHFEALRGEHKTLKAQPTGDNIDLDALITAYADLQTGGEMSDKLFTRMRKIERNMAVLFMVDVSGSTKGWINDAERESLVLLCTALEILGDRYAIYGFSGMTRNRCEVYKVKTFEQQYDADVAARISGLRPQDYTRMGVAVRHLTAILSRVEARTRILITLSDGKPDDYDGYRGDYGIEDTRRALLETRHAGIHPFCITIDKQAGDYLPYMYGQVGYAVVDEVRKLPLKVAAIYRHLTT